LFPDKICPGSEISFDGSVQIMEAYIQTDSEDQNPFASVVRAALNIEDIHQRRELPKEHRVGDGVCGNPFV
jgi:hypothetical protein